MKTIIFLFVLCSIFLFSSCLVRTIYPLFNDNEIIFEPKLIGRWMNSDSSEIWEFTKFCSDDTTRNQNKYRLLSIGIYKDGKIDTTIFEAMTGTIGKYIFLDITIDNREFIQKCSLNLRHTNHLIFTHTINKLIFKDDSLSLVEMSKDWFKKNLKKLKIDIIPRDDGDFITLTSRTKKLQKFINKFASNKEAFPESGYLHKLK